MAAGTVAVVVVESAVVVVEIAVVVGIVVAGTAGTAADIADAGLVWGIRPVAVAVARHSVHWAGGIPECVMGGWEWVMGGWGWLRVILLKA